MKIISFSLWGDNTRYTQGAIRNAELAKDIYPGWICRYYISDCVPIDIIDKLVSFENVELINMGVGDWTGMFWRFRPAGEESVEVMLSRDVDSRLTVREKMAVDEWLNSDKGFHIMRDNVQHNTAIMGGMWGAKKGAIDDMNYLIDKYIKGNFWQADQNFLREMIYPLVKQDSCVHDEFFENKPFPARRDEKHFVGQAYAGDDKILDAPEYFFDYLREQK